MAHENLEYLNENAENVSEFLYGENGLLEYAENEFNSINGIPC